MENEKHHFTPSELRGISLIFLGVLALLYYFSWWFTTPDLSFLGAAAFCFALAYGVIQLVGNWILYLATHYRTAHCAPSPVKDLSVDVFITAYHEDHALIAQALKAACAMAEEKKVWLLDDGNDPALAEMAASLGVEYLTRTEHHHAKAGNINAALARTTGDIIVIFDIDHTPTPDFLTKTLGCFANPEVGFVQVMLTFANRDQSWISSVTADTSLDFYNPTSIGADGMRSATLIGSNALIRRKALESIEGYRPGLAEDLATSIALHAAGWRSVYIPEPLAPGIAPPDLNSWFTQQLKWSRGVFELLLTDLPRYFRQLQLGHNIMYAVRMTYYWIGLFTVAHLFQTILVLWSGSLAALQNFESYLFHLAPLIGMTLLIRQLALRRWSHPSLRRLKLQWKPTVLVFATWPVYTISWLMAIFRVPLRFQPTPKSISGRLPIGWLMPQIITSILLIGGLVYSIFMTHAFFGLVFGFALVQIVGQLFLVSDSLAQNGVPSSSPRPLATPLGNPVSSVED